MIGPLINQLPIPLAREELGANYGLFIKLVTKNGIHV